jgi:hypothetical protein
MNLDWYRHNWRWFKHLWSEWRKRRTGSFPYGPEPPVNIGMSETRQQMSPDALKRRINRMLAKARQRRRQTKEEWPMVKKGDILEYNPDLDNPEYDGLVFDERPGSNARYAVAVKDENTETQTLLVNDGSREYVIPSRWISAYAWFGWIPEDCEKVYYEMNREEFDAQEDW